MISVDLEIHTVFGGKLKKKVEFLCKKRVHVKSDKMLNQLSNFYLIMGVEESVY